ncbi:hypothetical protein DB30_05849 [Enhygromyxa salina]|uniref:Uncharacterized protein n=1 Tax=Enhygromyxa salina TaxID=215803 RepID=A0A0C1ZBP9_9BACT|nr:hypothetical protein DB30_05849 [Enhygromyxa salina]
MHANTKLRKRKVTFDDGGAPVGAFLMFGDHEVGQVTAPGLHEHELKRLYVRGTVPASFDDSKGDNGYNGLELELRTACGTQRMPLSLVAEEGRADPLLHFDSSKATATASTRVWTDVPDPKISIGEAEAAINIDHFIVNGLDCAPKHSVSVNGEVVGEIEAKDDALVGLFVAKDAATCYEVTVAHYSEDGGSTNTTILSGKRVYAFPHERIDYRFRPVPTVTVSKTGFARAVVGINVVSCDEA